MKIINENPREKSGKNNKLKNRNKRVHRCEKTNKYGLETNAKEKERIYMMVYIIKDIRRKGTHYILENEREIIKRNMKRIKLKLLISRVGGIR